MSNLSVLSSYDVHNELWFYIEALSTEVGGFGYAAIDGDAIQWYDIFLVPQKVSAAEVDLTSEGLTAAIDRASKDGALSEDNFVWVSWHSHHSMKAYWSSTDEKAIQTFHEAGVKKLLSFVGSHDHTYKCRLDLFDVEHQGIAVPHVTIDSLDIMLDANDPNVTRLDTEIALNVKKQEPKPYITKNHTWKGQPKQVMSPKALRKATDDFYDYDSYAWEDDDVIENPTPEQIAAYEAAVGWDTVAS